MRNVWKVALVFAVALGLGGALAQAQPLITGNTAAFGCGPILTSDFSLGTVIHQFYPDGAGGTLCPDGISPDFRHNGRGLAIGGTEVFYTELDEIPGVGLESGFGPSEFIHVADYNAGVGAGDKRLLPHPRPGTGIQDLTFSNGILYVLTGYDDQVPIVYGLNLSNGVIIKSGVTVPRVGFTDDSVDGFAILPNGNFLMNNRGASCIYAEYDKTDGHFIGNIINVPGAHAFCTGVDTDGTSLYFLTDFTGVTRTDFAGNMTGFNFFNGPGGEDFTEDISLVHPVTTLTDVGNSHLIFTLLTTDDASVRFDFQAELFKCATGGPCDPTAGSSTLLATGIKRCVIPPRNYPNAGIDVPISLPTGVSLSSGDVLGIRLATRIGTLADGVTHCGIDATAQGIRFYYDSPNAPSQLPLTIFPNPSQPYYFHSDGTTCTNTATVTDSSGVTTRIFNPVAGTSANPRCNQVGPVDARITNPWLYFYKGTIKAWSLTIP